MGGTRNEAKRSRVGGVSPRVGARAMRKAWQMVRCYSAWGLDADRRVNLLILIDRWGCKFHAD